MALTDLTRISTSGIATGSTIDAPILRKDVNFHGSQVGVVSALFDSSDDALEFGDNVKLRFGASNDLTLFHNSSDSVITHSAAGEGNLKILSGGAQSIECVKAGAVNITHNGSTKIETTTHGAVVTGVLTATSFSGGISGDSIGNVYAASGISTFYDLRVSNNLTVQGTTTTIDTNLIGVDRVEVGADSDTIVGVAVTQSGAADIVNLFDGGTNVLTVTDTGDVGIGSAIPGVLLDVQGHAGGGAQHTIRSKSTAANASNFVRSESSDNKYIGLLKYGTGHSAYGALAAGGGAVYANSSVPITIMSDGGYINFATGGNTERLRITSGGNVNIGTGETTQTARMLNVYGGATRVTQTSGGNTIEAFGHTTSGQSYGLLVNAGSTSGDYCANFRNKDATTLLRIRGDGKVGIGTHIPSNPLHILGEDPQIKIQDSEGGSNAQIFLDGLNSNFNFDWVSSAQRNINLINTGSGTVRVGIGHTVPDTLLHLQGDKPKLRVESTNTLEASAGTEEIGRIEFEATKGSNRNVAASLRVRQDGTWSTVDDWFSPTAIEFYTQDQSGTEITTPKLTITSTGSVLIDTTVTTEVSGDFDDLVIGSTSDTNKGISIVGSTTNGVGSLTFTDGASYKNQGIIQYRHADDSMRFTTAQYERLRITSDGNIGINSTSPNSQFVLSRNLTTNHGIEMGYSSSGSGLHFIQAYNRATSAWTLLKLNNGLSIDSSGRVLINKDTNRNKYFNGTYTGQLQVEGTNDSTRLTQFIHNSSGSDGHILVIGKSRGTSTGSYTAVQDDDMLGTISFQGADGDEMVDGARIESRVNGTPGNDDMHADIIFRTNHGTASPRERLRITAKGKLLQRQDSYSETYQPSNWGNAYYLKGGWMRFNSSFSNPTKDLVILADSGNPNNNMYIKVTVQQNDYPGNQQGFGNIHIGYAYAKRYGDSTGKWYVGASSMSLESGTNFHGNNARVGTLDWENANNSDTNTLRYTPDRNTNYDLYSVQVEVWENGNCSYYLHSDFVE